MGTVRSAYYDGRATTDHHPDGLMVRRAASILALIILLVSTVMAASPALGRTADAFSFADVACGDDLGYNTGWRSYDKSLLEAADESTHETKFPMQQLYGRAISWTTYNGSKKPDNMPDNFYEKLKGDPPDYVKKASSDSHKALSCWSHMIGTFIAGSVLHLSSGISSLTDFFVTKAVDPNFICQDPQNSAGVSCINLLAVIAGDGMAGSDGGIIGRLYSGLYLGLIVFAWACVALWAIWNGLFKRKLVSTLSAIGVSFIIFFLGVVFMSQPLLLAQFPMKMGTTLGSCVIEGVNGVNCMSSDSTNPNSEPSTGTECFVDANSVSAPDALTLIAKQATCKIWKAFVLEPWAQGQFGVSYEELYDKTGEHPAGKIFQNPDTKDVMNEDWSKTGDDPSVSMYAASGNPLDTCSDANTKYRYKNLALYQLNLQSSLHNCDGNNKGHETYHSGEPIGSSGRVYQDWYYVIKAMTATTKTAGKGANDISFMYYNWTGDYWGHRVGVAILSLISSIGGAVILATTSILAIMYLFTSVLLTAFAPLFFLIGVVPGTGKKIFLGWVEKTVSATLKYFACILWMMVTVELYGAVLGSSGGMGATLVFVLIVTLAMWFYRGEFINMVGSANFGGKQFSSKMGDWMKDRTRKAGRFAGQYGASRAVGFIKGGEDMESYRGKSIGGKLKTVAHNFRSRNRQGANQGKFTAMTQLSRGNGVVANAARTARKIQNKRAGQMVDKSRNALNRVHNAQNKIVPNVIDKAVDASMRDYMKKHPTASKADLEKQKNKFRTDYTNDLNSARIDLKKAATERDAVTGSGTVQQTILSNHANMENEVNKAIKDRKAELVKNKKLNDSKEQAMIEGKFGSQDDYDDAMEKFERYNELLAKGGLNHAEKSEMAAIEKNANYKKLNSVLDNDLHDDIRSEAILTEQNGTTYNHSQGRTWNKADQTAIDQWDIDKQNAEDEIKQANDEYDEKVEINDQISMAQKINDLAKTVEANDARIRDTKESMSTSNRNMSIMNDAFDSIDESIDDNGNIVDRDAFDENFGSNSARRKNVRRIGRADRAASAVGGGASKVASAVGGGFSKIYHRIKS